MKKNHSGHQKNAFLSSDEVLKISLLKFFQKKENIEKFLPILTRTSSVSLRLLDYFCVNYSKMHPVTYVISDKYFDAYSSYKNQLAKFGKRQFDPFRRNDRVPLCYNGKKYYTTIAQLCFFKWCLTYNVIEYVEKHKNEINQDMKNNFGKVVDDTESTATSSSGGSGSSKKKRRSKKNSNPTIVATRVYKNDDEETIVMTFD